MSTAQALPVLSYATGSGWQTHGYARSIAGAKAIIRKVLSDGSRQLIERHSFQLSVGRRSDLQVELNGGPQGFIWSIGKVVNTKGR